MFRNMEGLGFNPEVEKSQEISVDNVATERVFNRIKQVELIERLQNREQLSGEDRQELANNLQNRGWQKIFSELSSGDKVAYFTAPAGDFSIKSFNDKYFGPQMTDEIRDFRNITLNDLMAKNGCAELMRDYKSGVFKLDTETETTELVNRLNQVAKELDDRMKEFILSKIEEKKAEINISVEEDKGLRIRGLDDLKNKLEKFGFVMSFGISSVEENNNPEDKSAVARAIAHGSQASLDARKNRQENVYGGEYNSANILKEIKDLYGEGELVAEILNKYSILTDQNGITYKVFSQIDGRRKINPNLARLARKGKFVSATENDRRGLEKVEQYLRRINIIDMIRPNTAEEISGQEKSLADEFLSTEIIQVNDLVNKILVDNLSDGENIEVVNKLNSEQKDVRFNSDAVFHREAIKKDHCVYISLDVIDLGVDQLLDYEQMLQSVKDENDLQKVTDTAGDEITKKMRQVRGQVAEIYQEYFGEVPLVLVGGDEITIAMEEKNNLDEFMLALRQATGSRVVKTAVASSERKSKDQLDPSNKKSTKKRIIEHLSAQKRAEKGVEYAKEIESKKHIIAESGMAEQAGRVLAELGLKNFIVKEIADGEFVLVSDDYKPKREVPTLSVIDILDKILVSLKQQTTER